MPLREFVKFTLRQRCYRVIIQIVRGRDRGTFYPGAVSIIAYFLVSFTTYFEF
jgi:hypothetical protein